MDPATDTQKASQPVRQLWLGIPARFALERSAPVTAGELIIADAADRARARREIERRQAELEVVE